MKLQALFLLLTLLPSLTFGQLYKCDSIYRNENFIIFGGYKNGLKHGAWDYRSDKDHNKVIKYEEYWFGELVRKDTINRYSLPMFKISDSIIEYAFKPTVKFVIQKLLSSKPEENYYCEIEIKETGNISLAFYHRIQRKEHDLVDRFCSITNRYMIIEHQSIPIITEYDRKFAHLGWTIGYDFEIILDPNESILEIIKNGW